MALSTVQRQKQSDSTSHDLRSQLMLMIGKARFDLWFASARLKLQGGALHVTVPNRFAADWVHSRFNQTLQQLARQEHGDAAEVRIHVDPDLASPGAESADEAAEATEAPRPRSRSRRTAPAGRHPLAADEPGPSVDTLRYGLDDFVVGPSNELAYTAACQLIDESDHGMNPLFIHGGCGLGKTHLLQGLCRRYAEQHPDCQWSYTTAEQFTNAYIAAVRGNRLGEFRRKLRRLDLLALDDVHFLANKSGTQTEFLHTFNAINLHGARVVMASDAHPKQIQQFSEALVSRFVSGMVVQVHSPDAATRRSLIQTLADRRGMPLTESALQRLIDQPAASVREIEGLLTRLAAVASLDRQRGRTVDLALVEQVITPGTQPTPRPVPVERIVELVCDRLGVERTALMGRGRHRRVVLARSLVIHLARQLTTLSYPELARALGRKNHSTIVTADRRVEQQIAERQALPLIEGVDCQSVDQLAAQLRREVVAAVQTLRS